MTIKNVTDSPDTPEASELRRLLLEAGHSVGACLPEFCSGASVAEALDNNMDVLRGLVAAADAKEAASVTDERIG